MKFAALVAGLALLAAAPRAAAQREASASVSSPVLYDVSFPDAVHHEARIAITFHDLSPGTPLEAVVSRASPGRYALHEFAKNVYDVSAVDGSGRPVELTRDTPYSWRVTGHDGTVVLRYTVFGDHADGTYAGIDSTHAHFNMPAAFAFARGLEDRPIRVTFHPVYDWRIATQLVPTDDPATFEAPDLQYFMDSPTELSAFTLREWRAGPDGRTTIRLALHHQGTDEDATRFADMARRIVDEEAAVFGSLPAFDHGTYTFIADYLPWVYGDGMEHRNSTLILSRRPLATGALDNLGTLAHEFFHAWNMERLRAAQIEPFDFERADMSDGLWFGEGFTNYYGHLILARAGFVPLADFAAQEGQAVSTVVNSPARRLRSPLQMSQEAPFVDAATSIDLVNRDNTFISYYTWGEVVALGLDLTLRERFGRTLDDYMRAMWREYGALQEGSTPARPYTVDDLQRVLGEVAADPAFAAEFFRRFVRGREVPDFAALLAPAGLTLRPARPDRVTIGPATLEAGDDGLLVAQPTLVGTPLYVAGVDNGDRIVELGGRSVRTSEDVAAAIAGHAPGDTIAVAFVQRGMAKRATLVLAADPELELVPYEAAGRPVTDAMRALREAWLGSKAD